MRRAPWVLAAAATAALALALACGGASQPGAGTVTAPTVDPASAGDAASPASNASGANSAATTTTSDTSASSATDAKKDAGPKMCGCALCEPLVSDDACTTDADCAPSTPCHAPACVAKAKAEPRKQGQMCSMIMVCTSADANGCGCFKGHCALVPKSAK